MSTNQLTRKILDNIVQYLAAGGVLVITRSKPEIIPYLTPALRRIARDNKIDDRRLIRYLKQQDIVSATELSAGRERLRLAQHGIVRAQKISLATLHLPKPKRWDGKWRLVFFDIPEAHRQSRNKFVAKLKDMGFYQLQRSMWIHPYPCTIEIEYLKRTFNIRKHVYLGELERIDRAPRLARHFQKTLQNER